MNKLTNWTSVFYESLNALLAKSLEAIPNIIGVILILLIGWLFAKVIAGIVSKVLRTMKFDVFANRIQLSDYLEKANVKLSPSQLIGKVVYWILLLLVLISASDTLGWDRVSNEISRLLGFLPNLFIALMFFVIGTYIAAFIRDVIKGATSSIGISSGKMISNVVFYFLFVVVTITALEQAGLDTTLITSNLLLIIGTVLLAAGISYGIASKDVLSNILAGFFSRRTFHEGQIIEVDGVRGKIIETSNISITIRSSEKEKIIIPTHELIVNKVKIIEE